MRQCRKEGNVNSLPRGNKALQYLHGPSLSNCRIRDDTFQQASPLRQATIFAITLHTAGDAADMAVRANMVINVVRNISFTSAEIEFTILLLPPQYKCWGIRGKLQGLLTM